MRSDDNEETIRKRLETNRKDCEPIVNIFKEKFGTKFVREIDAARSIDEVWKEVEEIMEEWFGT